MKISLLTIAIALLGFSSKGLAVYPWATTLGDTLAAANVTELKTALDVKRVECGFPAHAWQSDTGTNKVIKATDIEEIRDVYTETAEAERNRFRSTLTDFTVQARVTKVSRVHVTELRTAIDGIDCAIISTPAWTDCKTITCPASHPYIVKAPLNFIQGNDPYLCMVLNTGGTSLYVRDGDNCSHSGASGNIYCSKKKPADSKSVIQKSQISGGGRRFLNCDTSPRSAYCDSPDSDFCLNPLVGDETVLDSTTPVKTFTPLQPYIEPSQESTPSTPYVTGG